MAKPVFIGDEVTAAGFRLAGLSVDTPPPAETVEVLKQIHGTADLVVLGAEHAEALPADRLDTALRDADMLLVVVPDINQQFVPVDMEIRIRSLLGIET
ncbi:MAG: hypothetical protein KDJ90_19640 [Nitratireductor sp.]|nr:hypothetical protein [Nitratireductor sp.]